MSVQFGMAIDPRDCEKEINGVLPGKEEEQGRNGTASSTEVILWVAANSAGGSWCRNQALCSTWFHSTAGKPSTLACLPTSLFPNFFLCLWLSSWACHKQIKAEVAGTNEYSNSARKWIRLASSTWCQKKGTHKDPGKAADNTIWAWYEQAKQHRNHSTCIRYFKTISQAACLYLYLALIIIRHATQKESCQHICNFCPQNYSLLMQQRGTGGTSAHQQLSQGPTGNGQCCLPHHRCPN